MYLHAMDFYSDIKKNKIISFVRKMDKIEKHHIKLNKSDKDKYHIYHK